MNEISDYQSILRNLTSALQEAKPELHGAKFTQARSMRALRAVLWLHKPIEKPDFDPICQECSANYALDINWPCETAETVLDGWFVRTEL